MTFQTKQKEALKESHRKLWAFFGQVNFDQENPRAWHAFFEDEDPVSGRERRRAFYERLSAFTKLMEIAMSSYSLYSSIGFEQMQVYKKDLLFFQKLRTSLMKIYAEKVDFRQYEDGIRSLLNNFITSDPVETIVEPVPVHDKTAMDQQLAEIEGEKSKAAYIRTRLVSELEAKKYDDPMFYRNFSERIRETLAEYRTSRDEKGYLSRMRNLADHFREGFTGYTYPSNIDGDNDAKAFYGIVSETLLKYHPSPDDSYEAEIGKLSSNLNE